MRFSLAFSLATAIFGGFTPAICTYLIEAMGNRAAPGLWLSSAAIISLGAVFASLRLSNAFVAEERSIAPGAPATLAAR